MIRGIHITIINQAGAACLRLTPGWSHPRSLVGAGQGLITETLTMIATNGYTTCGSASCRPSLVDLSSQRDHDHDRTAKQPKVFKQATTARSTTHKPVLHISSLHRPHLDLGREAVIVQTQTITHPLHMHHHFHLTMQRRYQFRVTVPVQQLLIHHHRNPPTLVHQRIGLIAIWTVVLQRHATQMAKIRTGHCYQLKTMPNQLTS